MKDMTYEINSVKNTLANSIKYNYVDASTPKLGEWAERWDSRFALHWCQHPSKLFINCFVIRDSRETQRSAHSPSLGVDAPT